MLTLKGLKMKQKTITPATVDWTSPASILAGLKARLARYAGAARDMTQCARDRERAEIMGVVDGGSLRHPNHADAFYDVVAVHNKTVAPVARVRHLRAP